MNPLLAESDGDFRPAGPRAHPRSAVRGCASQPRQSLVCSRSVQSRMPHCRIHASAMKTQCSVGNTLQTGAFSRIVDRAQKLEELAADGGVGFDGETAKRLFETLGVGGECHRGKARLQSVEHVDVDADGGVPSIRESAAANRVARVAERHAADIPDATGFRREELVFPKGRHDDEEATVA